MTSVILHNVQHFGNKIVAPNLEEAKISDKVPTIPEPGHVYLKNGVLHYRNDDNTEHPIHENAIREIVDPNGIISATVADYKATIAIAPADETKPGFISPEHYALLAGATANNASNTLVKRDDFGDIRAAGFQASDLISAPKVTILNSPQRGTDGINLSYLQTQLQNVAASQSGRDWKDSVRLGFLTNIPLNAVPPAQSGLTVAVGDSVILLGQTNGAENGARVWNGTTLIRREDSDADSLSAGATYVVESGDLAGNRYQLVTATFTLDTTPLTFTDVTDATIAGDGCEMDGRILHVRGTPDRIVTTANSVDIAQNFIGQTSIQTLGTVMTGTWSANTIAIEYGGSGSKTLSGSQENLGIEATVISVLGNGAAKVFRIKHDIGTLDVSVTALFQGVNAGVDFSPIDPETVEIRASLGDTPIPTNSLRVKITGLRNGANAVTVPATAVA